MSYEHIEYNKDRYDQNYNHKITFRSELDYHLCKVEYLKSEIIQSFSFFVEKGLYNHNIVVESIEHINIQPNTNYYYASVDPAVGISWGVDGLWHQSSVGSSSLVNQDQFVGNCDFATPLGIPYGVIMPDSGAEPEVKPEKTVSKKRKKLSRFDILDIEDKK